MRKFSVRIVGTKPILLHNPISMTKQRSAKKSGEASVPSPQEEAAAGCYWTKDGKSLAFPSAGVHSAMISVSSRYKVNKRSLSSGVSGSVEIDPELIPFGTKDYSVDTRRAIVQRQGILRSRPRLEEWELAFTLLISDDFPTRNVDVVREILEEAGRSVGIGDFRPQRKGMFGKFVVKEWKDF